MPIETIITAAILTVTGYMYNHGMPKDKKVSWLAKLLMPWKAAQEELKTKKISLMVYVNKDYGTAQQVQSKKPDLQLIEK